MKSQLRIAVAQYEIECLPGWEAFEDKMLRTVERAKADNADVLAISEYAGMEIASWISGSLRQQFEYIQSRLPDYLALLSSLSSQYQLYIQPGTLPVSGTGQRYRNRAYFFAPDGKTGYQDKIFLTPFEQRTQLLQGGTELCLFDTAFCKIGIAICYDCEFPILSAQLVHAGANLLLTPSCTEKFSGLTRVTISSRARAIENQCYVAQSCLIGKANWCDLIDINTGQSGIYCPADSGFPEQGILAQAQLNTPMMIAADLSWDKLTFVRNQGEMRNFHDMQPNMDPILSSVKMVALS
jgi:predicted amidohydrolase